MQEVKEVIHMPKFDSKKKAHQTGGYKDIVIDEDFVADLGIFVTAIASMYRNSNPFHNVSTFLWAIPSPCSGAKISVLSFACLLCGS